MKNTLKLISFISLLFALGCNSNSNNPPSSNNSSTMSINSIYSMALGTWRLDSVKTFSSTNGNSTDYQYVGSTTNLTSVIAVNLASNCSSNYYNSITNEKFNGVLSSPHQDMWFIQDGNCATNIWPNSYRFEISMGAIMNIYSIGHIESINSNELVLVSHFTSAPLLLPQITDGWRAYWSKNTNNGQCSNGSSTVSDIDGNIYHIVSIGGQCWLKENLKTTHYRNGISIPTLANNANWQNATSGAACSYDNVASNSQTYGKLYNWYAVADPSGLCPTGWHVPTDGEWTTLIDFLGGGGMAGGAMKEIGISHWASPNIGATNSSGFTALGAGSRNDDGTYQDFGIDGIWWTSTSGSSTWAFNRDMQNIGSGIGSSVNPKASGFSVRCVHD